MTHEAGWISTTTGRTIALGPTLNTPLFPWIANYLHHLLQHCSQHKMNDEEDKDARVSLAATRKHALFKIQVFPYLRYFLIMIMIARIEREKREIERKIG